MVHTTRKEQTRTLWEGGMFYLVTLSTAQLCSIGVGEWSVSVAYWWNDISELR
jgi:hypothetical protein